MKKVKNILILTTAIIGVISGFTAMVCIIIDFYFWGFFKYVGQYCNPLFFLNGLFMLITSILLLVPSKRFNKGLLISALLSHLLMILLQ